MTHAEEPLIPKITAETPPVETPIHRIQPSLLIVYIIKKSSLVLKWLLLSPQADTRGRSILHILPCIFVADICQDVSIAIHIGGFIELQREV
jgi:hypothetical protein